MKYFTLLVVFTTILLSQTSDLYMSQPIKQAYKNGTRSFDGSPGDTYWLNKAEYKVKVSVNTETKVLDGSLTVKYFNNSLDTLNKIVMHLYPDLYKKGTARDWQFPEAALNEGVILKSLSVDGKSLDISDTSASTYRSGTNLNIKLNEQLEPSSYIEIGVDWNFIIPYVRPLRTGAYADTSMFIAYWYPKIAVYDDINGWDELAYTGQTEMYSGIADFDVEITAPKNFIVWATGELQNAKEVLAEPIIKKYEESHQTDSIIHIINREDLSSWVTKGDSSTWKYIALSSPDFAFALGKNYLWDASTVNLDDKDVFVSAAYRQESKNFKEVVYYTKEGIKFHSEEMPGVEFPYPSVTVFNGSGGMEFPMIINDGESSTPASTIGLTLHELAHTYFPFYLGINEKRYAFLDEGWAVFGPVGAQIKLGENHPVERRFKRQEKQFESIVEVPPMTPSYLLKGSTYRVASYTRSGAALFALEDVLGEEMFYKAMNTFVKDWKEKHPTPYDFFYTFNRVTGEDLEWFWKPWYFEFHSPDLNLIKYVNENGRKFVEVENSGGLPLSIELKVYFSDNTQKTISISPRVWQEGKDIVEVDLQTDKEIIEIELGHEFVPDINYSTREVISGD